ncbi:MAG: hypothetical protein ABI837_18095 [Acidobacteriota bacterium]
MPLHLEPVTSSGRSGRGGKDLDDYSLETGKMFFDDGKKGGFVL